MNMLARWAWRKLVGPRVIFFLCSNKVTGETTVFTPQEMEVVFRGR